MMGQVAKAEPILEIFLFNRSTGLIAFYSG